MNYNKKYSTLQTLSGKTFKAKVTTNWLESDSWIFVNYVPGSFGSFLTKCIESSPSVAGTKNKNFFDHENASHLGITIWIRNFHSGDELAHWLSLDHTQRLDFLKRNIQTDHCAENLGNRVHRLTNPAVNSEIKKYFPNAKFIKICVDNDMLDFVAKQMSDKTYTAWLKKITFTNPPLHKIISNLPEDLAKKKYLLESVKYIQTIIDNSFENHTYNFDVKNFVDPDKFETSMIQLYQWLNIAPADIEGIYKEFYSRHHILREDTK